MKVSQVMIVARSLVESFREIAVGKHDWVARSGVCRIQQDHGPIRVEFSQTTLRSFEVSALQQRSLERPTAIRDAPPSCWARKENAPQVRVGQAPGHRLQAGVLGPICRMLVVLRRFQATQIKHRANRTTGNPTNGHNAFLEGATRKLCSQAAEYPACPRRGLDAAAGRRHDDYRLWRSLECFLGSQQFGGRVWRSIVENTWSELPNDAI